MKTIDLKGSKLTTMDAMRTIALIDVQRWGPDRFEMPAAVLCQWENCAIIISKLPDDFPVSTYPTFMGVPLTVTTDGPNELRAYKSDELVGKVVGFA